MILERVNGYLILDNMKVSQKIKRNTGGEILKFFSGGELYFKECPLPVLLAHLFCEQIFRSLNIPVVHFDSAKYQGKTGVVSTSYNPNHYKEIPLKTILDKYYLEVVLKHKHKSYIKNSYNLYNLEDIERALLYFYKNEQNFSEIVSSLMQQITTLFFSQFLSGDNDMHYMNLVILQGENPYVAPYFDFDHSFYLQYFSNRTVVALEKEGHDEKIKRYPIDVLKDMLPLYLDILKEMLQVLPSKEEVLNSMEKSLGISLHPNLVRHICYDTYLSSINELVISYEKEVLKK